MPEEISNQEQSGNDVAAGDQSSGGGAPLLEAEGKDALAEPDEADVLGGDLEGGEEGNAEEGQEGEEEEVGGAAEKGEDGEGGMPNRVRLAGLSLHDKHVLLHAKATGKTFAEAEAELFGAAQGANDRGSRQGGAQGLSSTELRAEIEGLKAARRRAAEDFDVRAQLDITERIEAASEQLGVAAAREGEARERYQSSLGTSANRAEGAYPEAFVPGSPLHDAVLADKERLEGVNPAFFNDPEWPETLVYKHAARLGVQGSYLPAKAVQRPLARTPARAVPSPAPGGRSPAAHAASEHSIRQRLDDAKRRGDGAAVDQILRELERKAA